MSMSSDPSNFAKSDMSETFEGGGGHFSGRLPRLATTQRLLPILCEDRFNLKNNLQGDVGHFRENNQIILSKVAKIALKIVLKLERFSHKIGHTPSGVQPQCRTLYTYLSLSRSLATPFFHSLHSCTPRASCCNLMPSAHTPLHLQIANTIPYT